MKYIRHEPIFSYISFDKIYKIFSATRAWDQ